MLSNPSQEEVKRIMAETESIPLAVEGEIEFYEQRRQVLE